MITVITSEYRKKNSYQWLSWHKHMKIQWLWKVCTICSLSLSLISLSLPTHPVPEAMMTNVRVNALTGHSDLIMLIPTAQGPSKVNGAINTTMRKNNSPSQNTPCTIKAVTIGYKGGEGEEQQTVSTWSDLKADGKTFFFDHQRLTNNKFLVS